jgi:hypothetical protein
MSAQQKLTFHPTLDILEDRYLLAAGLGHGLHLGHLPQGNHLGQHEQHHNNGLHVGQHMGHHRHGQGAPTGG